LPVPVPGDLRPEPARQRLGEQLPGHDQAYGSQPLGHVRVGGTFDQPGKDIWLYACPAGT